jgi:hypothetical protein
VRRKKTALLISEELACELDEGVVTTGKIGIGLLDVIVGIDAELR